MCTVYNTITKKRIGYKVMATDGKGNFYSTFTGQQIEVGQVPHPPEYCERLSNFWSTDLNMYPLQRCSFYNKNYVGKTCAFTDKKSARAFYKEMQLNWPWYGNEKSYYLVLVKIKLLGTVYNGSYEVYRIIDVPDTIVGDHIESITIVK
ncbi:MAG: hypothetical protein JXB49_14270 [Bacteroidales bacterium]|nr:hypothetical protein [Bacteroidales bacterium]